MKYINVVKWENTNNGSRDGNIGSTGGNRVVMVVVL